MSNAKGATAVVCVDTQEARRNRARYFGATQAVGPPELEATTHELTQGHGLDLVLDFTGATPAIQNAWPRLRIGGRLVLVGSVFPGPPFEIFPEQVVRRQLTITGVHNYSPRHLVAAIDFLVAHQRQFPFAELVSAWHPLADTAEAFAAARESQAVRIGVCSTKMPL
jgi:threonine dehydrogenase-like Zn-dependent dehydrogenase